MLRTDRGHGYKSSSEGLKRLIETCCDSSEKHLLPPESPDRDLFSTYPKPIHFTLGTRIGIIGDGNMLPIGITMMKVGAIQQLKTFLV